MNEGKTFKLPYRGKYVQLLLHEKERVQENKQSGNAYVHFQNHTLLFPSSRYTFATKNPSML